MRISSFRIKNYKSFWDSEEVKFSSGFNILVGQNNVGKTALLEALALNFMGKPHKSLLSASRFTAALNPFSSAAVIFTINGTELRDILLSLPPTAVIDVPAYNGVNEADLLPDIFSHAEIDFALDLSANQGHSPNFTVSKFPSHGLYKPLMPRQDKNVARFCRFQVNDDKSGFTFKTSHDADKSYDFGRVVGEVLRSRIYSFHAQRFNLGISQFGSQRNLVSNATNLAEVLDTLQGFNPPRFGKLNDLLRQIFPSIYQVSTINRGGIQVEVVVWTEDPVAQREDLIIPLSDSGTGVGQVLAILYVVLTSDFPRTILIDEPNSFLHPAAARKLIEILRTEFSQHQYIVSTHSPEIIRAANPSTVTLIRWDKPKSVLEQLDPKELQDVQRCLVEVGAKLSDVFGADQILWVEGQTEEECYRLILERLGNRLALGMSVVAVRNTGDFESKHRSAETVLEIYGNLSKGNALIPPVVGFLFDRDGRTNRQMEDLTRRADGRVHFLPRRMYENYLICPEALEAIMAELATFKTFPISAEKIKDWLVKNGGRNEYVANNSEQVDITDETWLKEVHGAKLLEDLFTELSDSKEQYRKTAHSVQLTEWLIENRPEMLEEIKGLLLGIIEKDIQ